MERGDICDLFLDAVARFGEQAAITTGDQCISYRDLDQKSNRLANFLIANGATDGSVVAILLSETVEIVVAMLGCLKANAIFAPLDRGYPARRIALMLEHISPQWLIAESRFRPLYDALADGTQLIVLDQDAEYLAHTDSAALQRSAISDPGYIYFTSGSTGTPKAILGSRKGLSHFIRWEIETFGVDQTYRVSQLTPPSFDPFLRDVFVPLCAGATLCVPPSRDVIVDTRAFIRWLEESRVNLIHIIPTLFRSLLNEALDPAGFQHLRYVLVAGEQFFAADVDRWMRVYQDRIQLVNLYGPTETTLAKFCHFVGEADRQRHIIPVGKPIRGARAIMLDEEQAICPPGTVGEIYIRTPFRSLGYYREPALTAELFIQNPFSDDPNDVIYKTGDIGRVLEDGTFEILGRKDQQVKIAGMRVELGEIEDVLRKYPAITDVVVVDRKTADQRSLCAYLASAQEITSEALRAFLLEQLPDYMVPALFMRLDVLPRTLTGKIDRKALQTLGARVESGVEYAAPRDEREEQLAAIWREALGIAQIGIHHNVFTLGAHSLLVTQVLYKINQTFGTELPLKLLFDAPTIAEQSEAITQTAVAGDRSGAQPITPVERADDLPLSFAQQRLWFLDQLQPGNPAYNVPAVAQLAGPLDVSALRRSLALVVARHEALRTTFDLVDGQPVQRIAPALPLPLPLLDLTALAAADRPATAERLATVEARAPFDLACGPLLRTTLLRLHPEVHIALLTMHHIVSDGWSMGVLVRELTSAYAAMTRRQPTTLSPLPIQYADYAAWQRQRLHGEHEQAGLQTQGDQAGSPLLRHLAYWTTQLQGAPALLSLPTDFPRSAAQGFQGARQAVTLAPELVAQLQALSQRTGTTLFMTLLAGFALLLMHYSAQDDLVIGTPIAGRTQPETEELIGCFVNTLALRIDLAGNPSFVELLARVRTVALDAYAHQELPFERLVEALQPSRSLSHTPLFQAVFAFGTTPLPQVTASDLTITGMDVYSGTTKFDLTLSLDSHRPDLGGWLEYSAELFEDATITRILTQLQTLLAGIAATPDQPLTALPLSSPAEQQALVALGAASASFPATTCLHQLVEQQAARAPDAIALVAPDGQLSYRALLTRARQLAHFLHAQGVGRETIVGVLLEPSLDLVIALLAILQAGGAYLPLDPAAPPARLAFLLEDAQVKVLLTTMDDGRWTMDDALQSHTDIVYRLSSIVYLDADWPRIAQAASTSLPAPADPEQLAYLIYTSGSTGVPKGTLIPHANVVRLLLAAQPDCAFGPSDSWTLGHALSFDFAVWELWGALVWGGRLVLLPALLRRSPAARWALLVRERISVLNQTPAAFQLLIDAALAAPVGARSLRLVIFGGEALDAARLAPWLAQFGAQQPQLLNMYGITETTVHVTRRFLTAEDVALARGGSRIGTGLADLALYVRLAGGQPAPLGVPGELYVGGPGLARGYLNRPDLTAERFVPNPFARDTETRRHADKEAAQSAICNLQSAIGMRLYATGDRVRWLASGELEYLGRLDQQVKLRGYRIELGEVAAALRAHPRVRDAVVALGRTAGGDARLVAYVVPTKDDRRKTKDTERDPPIVHRQSSIVQELRNQLGQTLPDYMIPAAYVLLERLPLTAHGKLDRAALPPPTDERPDLETSYAAPRTSVEEVLAGIWAEVLGVAQVGIHDNFFELGGHSLLVTRVIARLQEVFPVALPVRIFFEWPTVAELADGLGHLGQEAAIDIEMIAQIFIQVNQFSEDEARRLLAEQTPQE